MKKFYNLFELKLFYITEMIVAMKMMMMVSEVAMIQDHVGKKAEKLNLKLAKLFVWNLVIKRKKTIGFLVWLFHQMLKIL